MTGAELRALRKEKGLKAYELAEMLDVNESSVSRWERGHRPVSRTVEYAVRWLCQPDEPDTPANRLVAALKEAMEDARAS